MNLDVKYLNRVSNSILKLIRRVTFQNFDEFGYNETDLKSIN